VAVNIVVTCDWCMGSIETLLSAPIPKGWKVKDVKSPQCAETDAAPEEEAYFCSDPCASAYELESPKAHTTAGVLYTSAFYSAMNELRSAHASGK